MARAVPDEEMVTYVFSGGTSKSTELVRSLAGSQRCDQIEQQLSGSGN